MSPRVVLVGPMGSGKSTVAALVARRLGVAALDTDAMVEAATGTDVAQVFATRGEPAFRALERAAVREALAGDGVVSLGGGAVLDPGTRADLRGLPVVLLRVSWPHAAARVGDPASRPLLAGHPQAAWEAVATAREQTYRDVATAVVDTDGLAPAQVADRVLRALSPPPDG